MNYDNNEDSLELINRLLERLHHADYRIFGSIVFNVYKEGSQHIDHVDNLYFGDKWMKAFQGKEPADNPPPTNLPFDDSTPLSALFRENHHEELRKVIDSWRPYLIDDDPMVDALDMTSFRFDFSKVIATSIYIDLGRLLYNHTMVDDNMNKLAWYLFLHTNLSQSQATLHAQLRKYKKR